MASIRESSAKPVSLDFLPFTLCFLMLKRGVVHLLKLNPFHVFPQYFSVERRSISIVSCIPLRYI